MEVFTTRPRETSVTIPSGGATSGVINVSDVSAGSIISAAPLTGTALSFVACNQAQSIQGTLKNETGGTVSITLPTAGAFTVPLPAEVFSQNYVKLVSNQTEGADRSLAITLRQ